MYLESTLYQQPKEIRSIAMFYRHEIVGVTVSARPGATLGVSLAEVLAFDRKAMTEARNYLDTALASLENQPFKFVLKVHYR